MARTGIGFIGHTTFVLIALLTLSGCATLRQFGPSVQVGTVTPGQYIALKRGDILTSGKLSAATMETLRVAGLDEGACAKPGLPCIEAMEASIVVREEDKRSSLAELWVQYAMTMPAPKRESASVARSKAATAQPDPTFQPRLDAWMQIARQSYAYLFFTERTANQRGFEDRQTQVRDYYNLAVQESAVLLFEAYSSKQVRNDNGRFQLGRWTFVLAPADDGAAADTREPIELVPAASMSFTGTLRSVHRRDGFGAELVAVMADPASTGLAAAAAGTAPATERDWSEMPSPSMTVLLRFSGKNLWEVLHDDEPELEIHDPYQVAVVELHGEQVPLAANFTAGYALWLARSNFSRQSLRTLFGGKGGIEKPHLFMMQPYDPNRRVLLMIHGLASSPEAWVNVANELMRDDEIRGDFQIWQFYYPTNMPIALSHDEIRRILHDTLRHFDPSGQALASHDMVVVAHSMGGVISRLMVSSSGDHLVDTLLATAQMTPAQRELLRTKGAPVLTFQPEPEISRVVFIATPHRGTDVAGTRLGRWLGRFVRLPLTVLEDVATLANDGKVERNDDKHGYQMNSIQNLDKDDAFVKAVADLPISPKVRYHSIIARTQAEGPLEKTDDGLVPYWSSHLPNAVSEKVIVSGHSVQEATPAIVELRRILHEDMEAHPLPAK
ncbi:alpha/beta hydrolase|uniref:esterase/lipase family protein n=1 Tax=Stenotrophomonas sp. SbOxS2 TaxID=2723885 RepID=UPI0015D3343B|nr:alpha/beta hydrolase [Stenotrophomonas sp. SbOxS2]NYU00634.1 alpha/beta hydrolase [Stenotrophomonas sp. SbOxS2]